MIRIYTQHSRGQEWLRRYQSAKTLFACVLAFTETALIPGISAAGRTVEDRKYTCVADAEFLVHGSQPNPKYPLPPLHSGASPVLISRAVVQSLNIPVYLFNAGLPILPSVPAIDLGGAPANCVSSGKAMSLVTVKHLLEQGLMWGDSLAAAIPEGYLIVGECVVGGTTTALAVLTGLGIAAQDKVNSSHPVCNHAQKWAVVQAGLERMSAGAMSQSIIPRPDPLQLVAAVGDPMQVVVAGMAIAASLRCGVLLAGGTQMLAVYALIEAIAHELSLPWQPEQIVVGTTRWVASDPTGNTVELARLVGIPLIATNLSFATSEYPQLRAYEQGYVKEGVGAGGCAIASHLTGGWNQNQLLNAIEALLRHQQNQL